MQWLKIPIRIAISGGTFIPFPDFECVILVSLPFAESTEGFASRILSFACDTIFLDTGLMIYIFIC